MSHTTAVLVIFGTMCLLVHVVSAALVIWRVRLKSPSRPYVAPGGATVALLRPVCGHDPNDRLTLGSTFHLAPGYETDIVFCAARSRDAAVPLVRDLIASHAGHRARLLIGAEQPTANPKLNNLVKGWDGTSAPWVIMADSNVLLPKTYIADLFAAWRDDTGLVCSPPIGSAPQGMAAEIECAILNTYQGRWQLAADSLGFGFAQGKSMLWRRDLLDSAGGLEALAADAAEDAAATKVVRAAGLRVRLVDRPFAQPLGMRRVKDVWDRQVRWARLRRATFPVCYAPEILAGLPLPLLAVLAAAPDLGLDPWIAASALAGLWFTTEGAIAAAAGWHVAWTSPAAFILREAMLPAIWVAGLTGDTFTWRGNEMTATVPSPSEAPLSR